MWVKLLLCYLAIFPGCSLFPDFKNTLFNIKAVIEGEIKGHKIHCEKTLNLSDGKWSIMCHIGNDMDVKYRVKPMSHDLAQIEFVVGKSKEGRKKILAAPTVVVQKSQSTRTIATSKNANIIVMAEHAR